MTSEPLQPDARVAIIGAGCAGVSAAVELLARSPDVNITVFESGDAFPSRRTWCSWSVHPHRFSEAVSDSWSRVRVRGSGRDTTVELAPYAYDCIRGEDFFRAAESEITRSTNSEIRFGAPIDAMHETPDGVTLTLRTADGSPTHETFDRVLDGRSCGRVTASDPLEPVLIQHFGGLEVDIGDAGIDRTTVTLMDFDVPQSSGAHFMYVLPYARGTALIESTFMSPPGYARPNYEAFALEYLEREFRVRSPRVVYRESGALPMTLGRLSEAPPARVWPIGTRAGIGRASSGYAFDAIQRDAAHVATALLYGGPRPRPPRTRLLSVLDRVLLSWLERDPSAAPMIFGKLFESAPTPALIRFLSDAPSKGDLLSTMWAMPKLRTTLHTLGHRSAWPRTSRAVAIGESQ